MEDLILGALEHQWPGRWRPFIPGRSAWVVESDTGLLVSYGEGRAIVAAGALVEVPLQSETIVAISDLNPKLPIGGLHIGQTADANTICLLVVDRMREAWLRPDDPASLQMVFDVVANLTPIARNVAGELAPKIGGQPWLVDQGEGWPMVFAGHL
jgi:hypothetical protein